MFEKAKEKVKQRKAREEASKKALTEAKQAEGSVGRDVGGTVEVPNGIVLFHYPFSPVARRVVWYLTLRGLGYAECIQPAVLPRPDINELGINYRRIPLLSIHRSILADSRLILQKLNAHFPNSTTPSSLLSPTPPTPEAATLTRLLSNWTQDGGVFPRASALIPTSYPVFKDGKFVKDRESLTGRKWSVEALEKGKKEVLVGIKECFGVLEGMFGDGRDWVLGTQNPSLGDIEGE